MKGGEETSQNSGESGGLLRNGKIEIQNGKGTKNWRGQELKVRKKQKDQQTGEKRKSRIVKQRTPRKFRREKTGKKAGIRKTQKVDQRVLKNNCHEEGGVEGARLGTIERGKRTGQCGL